MVHDCVEYVGHIGNAGYGLDYEPKTQKTVLAHRKAYYDAYGHIPAGLVVLHKCNNKRCVNPEHLRVGTQSENVRQSYRDGLQVNPLRSLTDTQVLDVLSSSGPQRAVAKQFGVSQTVIKNIRLGRTYKHLTGGGTCGS